MAWKEFKLTNVKTQETQTVEMPSSAPAPIVQDAKELMVGDAKGKLVDGEEKIQGSIKARDMLKAADHIAKKTLDMESFPRNTDLQHGDLDHDSLEKLKDHYMEVDLQGKNSNGSGGEQSSSEKQ